MGEESRSDAGQVGGARSGRWRAAWVFPLVWIVCWFGKGPLLAWVIAPLLGTEGRTLSFSRPSEAFAAFVELCTVVALIAVLPLLTPVLVFRGRRTPVGFVPVSYFLLVLAVVSVQFFLAPMFLRGFVPGSALGGAATLSAADLSSFLASLYLTEAAIAQLVVVFASRAQRASVRSVGWAIVRWLLLGLGSFVLAAVLTPPDPVSQLIVWLTWVLFWAIAKLAMRVFRASEPRRDNELLAEGGGESEQSNPYKPPVGG